MQYDIHKFSSVSRDGLPTKNTNANINKGIFLFVLLDNKTYLNISHEVS